MHLTADSKQRLKGCGKLVVEAYKVFMGAFLTLFVPHACEDGRICSVSHNLSDDGEFHRFALASNACCFFMFIVFYHSEISRENFCISYLDICPSKPNNNLDTEVEEFPVIKRRMLVLNRRYKNATMACCIAHVLNVLISLAEITQVWPGMAALAPLVSYVLLCSMKLYNSMLISSASLSDEKMFSAFLSGPRVFNTIDADYKKPASRM